MKKYYIIFCLLIGLTGISNAQITITQNDMPHPGDTTRLTSAQLNLFLNYAATGANHTWNFSDLRTNTQQLDSPMSVSATNLIYALFYVNFPFNTNKATVAYKNAGLAINPLIPVTNPFGFYYLNSSKYEQVGLGAELLNFPTPIAFANHDVIYNLPLNFGDTDTSNSNWGFGLAGLAYAGYTQTRTNHVDGWGSLITPHGTYNVLRVKTTRAQKDTIAIDSLNLNIALDRPLVTEYKWLANGETTPVLQINTQTIFGIEVITEILFIDDFLRIETNALASNVVCAGSTITVPYTKHGSFNGPGLFVQGNKFTAQLSDANGNFANPINIGTVTSKVSGNITATIPSAILPGTHYRIRVISSDPARIGSDNGTDITIEYPVITNINAAGSLSFCQPGSVELLADSGDGYSYQWQLNNLSITGATQATYVANQSGSYNVAVSNSCGTVNTPALVVSANPAPSVSINGSASQALCAGSALTLNATVTDAVNMQWQLNGVDITGEITDSLMVSQTGVYTLVATNACGTGTSAPVTVTVGVLPTVSISGNPALLCAGDSALLTSVSTDALTFQWQQNGIDMTGEINSSLTINQGGSYTLIATNTCGFATSLPVNITAGVLPTVSVTGAPAILCPGDSAMLNSVTTDALTFQWQLNGTDINGETNSTITILQGGTYTLIVSNDCGAVMSSATNVTTGVLPTVSITGAPAVLCAGDSAVLTSITTDALSYQWQLNGIDISGEINSSLSILQAGNYTLVATNTCGSVSSSNVSIAAGLPPTVAVTGLPSVLCAGDSALLLASTTDTNSFQWQLNGTDIAGAIDSFYFASASGSYTVIVSNNCGSVNSTGISITVNPAPQQPVIAYSTDTLYASPASSYQWYFNGNLIAGATSAFYIVSQNGLYSVMITDANGCTSLSADFNVLNVGIAEHNTDQTINIYPNPVQEMLYVNASNLREINEINIYNVLGQPVIHYTVKNENDLLYINTSGLKAGYYTVQVLKNGKISNYPLVKN